MYTTSSNRSLAYFRHKAFVWLLLAVLLWSFVPSISLAQQPTATISVVSGTVLVNGQDAAHGMVLRAGDVIETQAGASVVLELSDGSLIELSEQTKLDMTVLSQTATGARTSRVKLWWGRVRAQLSAGHQQTGSNFDIETPNALVGVKFSQPDVEVIYAPAEEQTTAFAHTVALWVTNLLTGEQVLVPVGSTVIITAVGIQLIAGITATGVIATETATAEAVATGAAVGAAAGMSTGTMIAIGAGVAAAGGLAAVAVSAGDGDDSGNSFTFTGIFRYYRVDEDGYELTNIMDLVQHDTSVTGFFDYMSGHPRCCFIHTRVFVTGDVEGNVLTLTVPPLFDHCECSGGEIGDRMIFEITMDTPSFNAAFILDGDGNLRNPEDSAVLYIRLE